MIETITSDILRLDVGIKIGTVVGKNRSDLKQLGLGIEIPNFIATDMPALGDNEGASVLSNGPAGARNSASEGGESAKKLQFLIFAVHQNRLS